MENKRPYDKEAYSCIPDPKFVPSPFGELSLGSVSLASMCCPPPRVMMQEKMVEKYEVDQISRIKKMKRVK